MNLKNLGNEAMDSRSGSGRPPGLTRQGSIYSLTFDELQGSIGKDFGSMNMDELLKNIWNAEEMQTMAVEDRGGASGANLQRQGSLTLPRTLSQKTVDEVWKDVSNGFGEPNLPQRQQTLGEMTLEEFLVKAGVVREEAHLTTKPNDNGLFQNTPVGFQQDQISFQSTNLPLSGNGARSHHQPPPQLFPKQTNLQFPIVNHLGSPIIRNGVMGISDPMMNTNLVSAATLQGGMAPSDGIAKSNGDTSSVSPAPYAFNGVLRGRKNSAIEKVVERRQRRMIKNRESAARSRARKQAYTMELEAEVSELKQKNQELKRKQAEMMEMQKNQVMKMMNMQPGTKRNRLKKTLSGPW